MQHTVTKWADITGGGRDCGESGTVCLGTWYKVDTSTDGRMILKWILLKQGGRFCGGLICLDIGTSGWLLRIRQ